MTARKRAPFVGPRPCRHPPARLFSGVANGPDMRPVRWVACCDCGAVLTGGAS